MLGFRVLLLAVIALVVSARGGFAAFTTFASGQVRPLAMSPDGTRLFAVNTPDDQLEIFSVAAGTGALAHQASVPVGLEPVAVAARSDTEVWVVNHLSDSVSVVDVGASPLRRGFGVKLIEEALAYEAAGQVQLRFPCEGVRCEIEIPIPALPA